MSNPYPGLGFNPVPGDQRAVEGVRARCHQAARALEADPSVRDAVRRCHEWTGPGADAFATRLGRIPARLQASREVLAAMADILDGWAATLADNQRRADDLDRVARGLSTRITDAQDELDRATVDAQFATGVAAADAVAAREAARSRLATLQAERDRVWQDAQVLERDHRVAADRVAERLRLLRSQGVVAAQRVPDRRELFGGIARTLGEQSTLGGGLTALLAGRKRQPEPVTPGQAAAAFALAAAGSADA
ncbi:MAG: hypothetical protein ACRDQB_04700 [Thermocrispum sp.]